MIHFRHIASQLGLVMATMIFASVSVQAEDGPIFKAQQVSASVWYVEGLSALGTPSNQNFISNAAFVVTPGGVVVIDALGSPALAVRLLAEIKKVTTQPVTHVLVTHYHADHIYGLQTLKAAGTKIVAHEAARMYLNSDTARLRLEASRQELAPWVNEDTRLVAADEWIDSDSVDFISQFARPLPQRVFASILGFPFEDIPQLAQWGDAVVTPFVHGTGLKHELVPDQAQEMFRRLEGFQDYIYEQVRAKRSNPQDDMVSFLCDVHYQALDRKLTDLEIAGIVHAMIIGALETTQYAIEEQAQMLCENDGLFDTVRNDRTKLRAFTEESMRLRSPTHGLSTRVTSRDEVFQGVNVPAGSLLHLRFAAANVDGEEFECPFDLDLERHGVTRHLAFSAGPRVCPGANLSRIEQQVAWDVLCDRLSSIEYGEGNDWQHQPGIMLGTLKLNLTFTKA